MIRRLCLALGLGRYPSFRKRVSGHWYRVHVETILDHACGWYHESQIYAFDSRLRRDHTRAIVCLVERDGELVLADALVQAGIITSAGSLARGPDLGMWN